MMVTGVQPVGARGLSGVQATVTDTSRDVSARTRSEGESERAGEAQAKPNDPQPVVFPRTAVNLDQRPVALRHHQATERYREDGGDQRDRQGDNDGETRRH
jgi:hypothetical protein